MAGKANAKWNPAHHPRDARGRFTRSATRVLKGTDGARARAAVTGFKPVNAGGGAGGVGAETLDRLAGGQANDEAMARYLAGGWKATNPKLRTEKDAAADPEVVALDKAFRPITDDVLLERRVPLKMFAHIPVDQLAGMKVRDAAPASTILDGAGGEAPDGMVTMHIAAPAGTPAYVNSADGEVILARDTEVAISKAVPNGRGGWDLYGVVIPRQGAQKPARAADGGDQGDETPKDGAAATDAPALPGDGQDTATEPAAAGTGAPAARKPAGKTGGGDAAGGTPDAAGGTPPRKAGKAAAPAAAGGADQADQGVPDVSPGKDPGAKIGREEAFRKMHGDAAGDAKFGKRTPAKKTDTDTAAVDEPPAGSKLAELSPVERATLAVAVEEHGPGIFQSPLTGGSIADVGRYVSEGSLRQLTDKHGHGTVWAAVEEHARAHPEILTRTLAERDLARAQRAKAASVHAKAAAAATKSGDYATARNEIDTGELVDPGHRESMRSWDSMRAIVARVETRKKSDQDTPADPLSTADTSAPRREQPQYQAAYEKGWAASKSGVDLPEQSSEGDREGWEHGFDDAEMGAEKWTRADRADQADADAAAAAGVRPAPTAKTLADHGNPLVAWYHGAGKAPEGTGRKVNIRRRDPGDDGLPRDTQIIDPATGQLIEYLPPTRPLWLSVEPNAPHAVTDVERDAHVAVTGSPLGSAMDVVDATGYVATQYPSDGRHVIVLSEYPGGAGRRTILDVNPTTPAIPAVPDPTPNVVLWRDRKTGRAVANPSQTNIVRGDAIRDPEREENVRAALAALHGTPAAEPAAPVDGPDVKPDTAPEPDAPEQAAPAADSTAGTSAPAAAPAKAPAVSPERAAALTAKREELQKAGDALGEFNYQPYGNMRTKSFGRRTHAALSHTTKLVDNMRRLEREVAALEQPERPKAPAGGFTPEQLAGARFIRTKYSWHEVVKVNRASVKVKAAPGMDDLIAVKKIVEVRGADTSRRDALTPEQEATAVVAVAIPAPLGVADPVAVAQIRADRAEDRGDTDAARIRVTADSTSAVAGRTFARTQGVDVAADDTRFRMRVARVGKRQLDRHDVDGNKLGSLSEAPDGKWIARDTDDNPVGYEPSFTAANTRIEQAADRRQPPPAAVQVPDAEWDLTPKGPPRALPGADTGESGPLPDTDPAVADQLRGESLNIPKRLAGLPAAARSGHPDDASGIRYGGVDADGTLRDDQGRAVGRVAGDLPDEGWVRVDTAVPVAMRIAGGSAHRQIAVWRPAPKAAPDVPAGSTVDVTDVRKNDMVQLDGGTWAVATNVMPAAGHLPTHVQVRHRDGSHEWIEDPARVTGHEKRPAAPAPASTAGASLPAVPAAQPDMFGGETEFVPASRSTLGMADRADVGRTRGQQAVQQLGMFDVSDERQIDGQGALLDALFSMSADEPAAPAAVDVPDADVPAPAPAAPAVTVPDDLTGHTDEQLGDLFRDAGEDELAMARITDEWDRRESEMQDVLNSVPDDLTALDHDAVADLFAAVTAHHGTMDSEAVARLEADLDRRDREHVANLADLDAKRALISKPPADYADDDELSDAMAAAADLGDEQATYRIAEEWDRREESARAAGEQAAAEQADADRARQEQETAAAVEKAAAANAEQAVAEQEAGLDFLSQLLASVGTGVNPEPILGQADQADDARLADARRRSEAEMPGLVAKFAGLSDDGLGRMFTAGWFGSDPARKEEARLAQIERQRRKALALAEQTSMDARKERRRLIGADVTTLTDAELRDFPALLDALPGTEVGRLREERLPLIRAEVTRRQGDTDVKAERRAAGPAGPLRSQHVMAHFGSVESWLNPKWNKPTPGSRQYEPAARWSEAKRTALGLPSTATDAELNKAGMADKRPFVDRAAVTLAWYRHLTEVDAPETLDSSDNTLIGWVDEPDVPDTVEPAPPANITKADEVWEALAKQAVIDRDAGDWSGVDRYYRSIARAYRVPHDGDLTGQDLARELSGGRALRALQDDPRTDKQKMLFLVAEWRRAAAEAGVDPSDSLRYGPADRGVKRPKLRGTWRESTPAQEEQITALVGRGRDWTEAYAEVHGLDVADLRREEADNEARSTAVGTKSTAAAYRQHYDEMIHSAWVDAETGTAGNLLSPEGKAAKVDPVSLFSGPSARAYKYASEELKRWWAEHPPPRMTFAQYKQMVQGDSAGARASMAQTGKGNEFL